MDESKRAKGHLLEAFKLPVEIVKFGHAATVERIVSHLKESIKSWKIRENADGSLYETDNHNFIMDLECAPTDLKRLDEELKSVNSIIYIHMPYRYMESSVPDYFLEWHPPSWLPIGTGLWESSHRFFSVRLSCEKE